jgi:hypothetical protein
MQQWNFGTEVSAGERGVGKKAALNVVLEEKDISWGFGEIAFSKSMSRRGD